MWTWEATVRVSGAFDFTVVIQAPDQITATRIIESQYGKGCIVGNNVRRV